MIYIYNLHLFIGGRHGEFVRFFKLFRKPKIVFIPECPDEVKLDNLGKELNTTQIHNKRGNSCAYFSSMEVPLVATGQFLFTQICDEHPASNLVNSDQVTVVHGTNQARLSLFSERELLLPSL